MIPTIQVPKGQELVVVGDIHENEWHFEQMIERAEIGTKRILVSVGDVYDKGEGHHVAERIVKRIRELGEDGYAMMVRGNHEQRAIKQAKLNPELKWCKKLPLILSFVFSNQNRVTVVHGGVTPHHSWGNVSNNTEVMYVRTLDEKDRPIPLIWKDMGNGVKKLRAEREGTPWHDRYDGRFGYIIAGHESQADGIPKFYQHSCNIDTKCYETGILTGQIVSQGVLTEMISIER